MSNFPHAHLRFAVLAAALCILPSLDRAFAADVKAGALEITAAWSRATPKGAKVGGGYLKITNTGTQPDRLTGGSMAAADKVEVHEMSMKNGVMKMQELANGLEIKPGETVELKPGGLHLMFVNLKKPLTEGEHVKATLNFAKAG
jgi:copper(I)-binding protein